MKKVLFLTTRLISPINDGRKVVLYNYCKGLVEQHNCEVRLFSLIDDEERNIKQPSFISKVYFGKMPSRLEKIKNLLNNSLILNKWPFQVSLYYSKSTQKKINNIIKEYKPDIVICDMARTAEYFKHLDDKKYNKILDMDDLLSKRYYRQIESRTISLNSIGALANKLPKILQNLIKNPLVMKSIMFKEAKLLSKYEINISKYYRSIVFVSPIEAKEFNKKIHKNKSIDITIGVDYDYFSEKVIKNKKSNYVVFLGNMNVAHNRDSVNNFLENIFPHILKEYPNCIFRVVGKCNENYKNILKKYKNVEVTGEVDDIRKHVQDCAVSVAPLLYGTGIKTKILETMAMGVSVITNDIGNEGIGLENNKQIIIEKNLDKMGIAVLRLLNDVNLQNKISKEADEYIKNNHKWNDILEKFKDVI
ncbi:glycosyltransferase [Clostridium butyricum]|uniref:Glycosyltransferase n=1 Tax=Clostridium butyricum TaxID=1492 RepID=A0A6L9ERM7_CLOBU|nr:glycosyltransferase [Clostridium butyricum]